MVEREREGRDKDNSDKHVNKRDVTIRWDLAEKEYKARKKAQKKAKHDKKEKHKKEKKAKKNKKDKKGKKDKKSHNAGGNAPGGADNNNKEKKDQKNNNAQPHNANDNAHNGVDNNEGQPPQSVHSNKPDNGNNGNANNNEAHNGQVQRPLIGRVIDAAAKVRHGLYILRDIRDMADYVRHLAEKRRLYGAVRNLDEARHARAYYVTVNDEGNIVATPDEMIATLKSCNMPLIHKNSGFKVCFEDCRAAGYGGISHYLAGHGALILVAENYRPDIAQSMLLRDWDEEKLRSLRRFVGKPCDEHGAPIALSDSAKAAWQQAIDSPDMQELRRIENVLRSSKYDTLMRTWLNLAMVSDSFFSCLDPQSAAFKRSIRTTAAHALYAYTLRKNLTRRKSLEQLPRDEAHERDLWLNALRERERLRQQQQDAHLQAEEQLADCQEALRISQAALQDLRVQVAHNQGALSIVREHVSAEQVIDNVHNQREAHKQRNSALLSTVRDRILALTQ